MKSICTILFAIAFSLDLDAQTVIEGRVLDENGLPIQNALIKAVNGNAGISSSANGSFEFPCQEVCLIEISHINYQSLVISGNVGDYLEVVLQTKATTLEELEIEAEGSPESETVQLSQIEALPVLLGEADVLKYLVTLPGVSSISTFDAGISVRGGSTTENVFLVNEMAISDPKHISTLVTAYDPYVLNQAEIHKSGYPIQYNGYLSGYVNMSPINQTPDRFQAELSAGWISSSAKFKTPIGSSKNHIIAASARQSYLHLIAEMYERRLEGTNMPDYSLRDLTMSYRGLFRNNWEVSVFGLLSEDDMPILVNENQEHNLLWNTKSGVASIEKKFADGGSMDFSFSLNNGRTNNKTAGRIVQSVSTETDNFSGRFYFQKPVLDSWVVTSGLQFDHKGFEYLNNPDEASPISESSSNQYGLSSGFVGLSKIYDNLTIDLGANVTYFDGDNTSLDFSPRAKILFSKNQWSLWADYARTLQFEERLAFFTIRSPIDMNIPLGPENKPATSDQVSIGASTRLFQTFKLESGVFYKNMDHLKDFTNSSRADLDFLAIEMIEGTGYAAGIETSIEYAIPRFQTRASYTFSRSRRTFAEINDGRQFRPPYDVSLSGTITASYQITDSWSFNALWMYTSGIFITMPEGVSVAQDITRPSNLLNYVPIYGDRYNYQLPSRHRLDLSVEYLKQYDKNAFKFTFGTYNTYDNDNVDFVFLEVQPVDDFLVSFVPQSRLVIPFVPYFSFTFYFNGNGK